MKRGEIYYIKSNYAETGFEQRADRPAVIVSNDKCNEHSGVLEVVYMTRKAKKPLPTHVIIKKDSPTPSVVLCEQITSVDIGRFSDFLGRVTDEEMLEIDTALAVSLALPLLAPEKDEPADAEEEDDVEELDDGEASTINDELYADHQKLQTELEVYKRLYGELLEKVTR